MEGLILVFVGAGSLVVLTVTVIVMVKLQDQNGLMSEKIDPHPACQNNAAVFGSGAVIGTLGGLIGLGGAEFRLPLLIKLFRFHGLEAVILNKAVSLVVVATALPFRANAVPLMDVADMWTVIVNILAGSLLGAWVGASGPHASRRQPSIASSR